MNEYNKYGKKLEEQLRLKTYPLAIRMLRTSEDIPLKPSDLLKSLENASPPAKPLLLVEDSAIL
jgi:hypothetical protein